MRLERTQAGNPTVCNRTDRALIGSLERQHNDATQQLNQLHAGHGLSAAEGQLAAQQSQTNEQLEALHKECEILCEGAAKVVAERDTVRRDNLKLRMASLTSKSTSTSEPTWWDSSLAAKAKLVELQKENTLLKEINVDQSQILDAKDLATLEIVDAAATLTAVEPLAFPTLSGGEWADDSSLSTVGERIEWTKHAMSGTPSLEWGEAPWRISLVL